MPDMRDMPRKMQSLIDLMKRGKGGTREYTPSPDDMRHQRILNEDEAISRAEGEAAGRYEEGWEDANPRTTPDMSEAYTLDVPLQKSGPAPLPDPTRQHSRDIDLWRAMIEDGTIPKEGVPPEIRKALGIPEATTSERGYQGTPPDEYPF